MTDEVLQSIFSFKPSGKERKHCSLACSLTLIWHLYCQVLFNYFGLIVCGFVLALHRHLLAQAFISPQSSFPCGLGIQKG